MEAETEFLAMDRRDWRALGLLLVLAGLIHAWLLLNTEVAARDCIEFIRYAWKLEHHPLAEVVRSEPVHPGYPVVIYLVKPVVGLFCHQSDAVVMEKTAQIVSAVMGLFLVVPMYFLGRELFSARVGFWAALFFQCLPAAGRVLSDGLSEATFYFFFAMSAWQGVRGFRTGGILAFSLCGIFGACAYLTRPEGALIVAVTGFVLLMCVSARVWRHSWKKTVVCALGLSLSAIVAGSPIYVLTGQFTTKPTMKGRYLFDHKKQLQQAKLTTEPMLGVMGMEKSRRQGLISVATESMKGFGYVGWIPALLGMWWHRSRLLKEPGQWLALLASLGICFLMWRVATVEGYLSDRHALILIFFGMFWMAAGLELIPGKMAGLLERWRLPQLSKWCGAAYAPMFLMAVLAMLCLPRTLQRLHYNRGGFRDAGLWLADHTTYADDIVDPYCWSHYYAGRVFIEGTDTSAKVPAEHKTETYVVIEEAGNPHPNLPEVASAILMVSGQPHSEVYRWKGHRGKDYAEVAVYRLGD
jgi:hypothetical protein